MSTAPSTQRTFLGHPIGLYVLFFTEMWERFSYYGMRALLILYMINFLKMAPKEASTIYKVYTSFVYVTPILGGFLADRYLGNKKAVIIGAILMAIGHFLMAFEEFPIFLAALIFLIFGNGFFKPNMTTQVGRLYRPDDGRRDGAYTIFYMGINLGAFLSPIACGWLAENTVGGFHSGFTLAGIGMVLGLAIYLLGQPFIREIAVAEPPASADPKLAMAVTAAPAKTPPGGALTEAEAAATPSIFGGLSNLSPMFLILLGVGLIILAPVMFYTKRVDQWDAIMIGIGGSCLLLLSYVCANVMGGMRDRVLAILMLGVFVIFFWAAFEQAGNVLNVWADQATNRFLTQDAPKASVIPEVHEDAPKAADAEPPRPRGYLERFLKLFPDMVTLKPNRKVDENATFGESMAKAINPVPTAWFQSINALAIFVFAPLFAWLWIFLDRRRLQPSIPLKMTLGLLFMAGSMVVMMGAAKQEHILTAVAWNGSLPSGIEMTPEKQLAVKDSHGQLEPFHAGRLTFDGKQFALNGVLSEPDRDGLVQATAPAAYRKKVEELMEKSKKVDGKDVPSAEVDLGELPEGFDMKFAGIRKSVIKLDGTMLIAYQPFAEKELKGLMNAAGAPGFRTTIHDLFVESTKFRVSAWWLFWSYILATFGELCLSPVGLSMVSKLAPAKFATMLMGVWMLTSAFGNFVAGALGEKLWGTLPPIDFFILSAAVVGGAAFVLFILCRLVVATMHGVK